MIQFFSGLGVWGQRVLSAGSARSSLHSLRSFRGSRPQGALRTLYIDDPTCFLRKRPVTYVTLASRRERLMDEAKASTSSQRHPISGDWFLWDYPPGVDPASQPRTPGGLSRASRLPGRSQPPWAAGSEAREGAPAEPAQTQTYKKVMTAVSGLMFVAALLLVLLS